MATTRYDLSTTAWTLVAASGLAKFTCQLERKHGDVRFQFAASDPGAGVMDGLEIKTGQAITREHASGALYARGAGSVVVVS